MDPQKQTTSKYSFRAIFNKILNFYHKVTYFNPKKTIVAFISLFLSLLVILITVKIINQPVFYKPKAGENQITPIVLPGSLLDTGIKAENFTDVDHNSWSWKYIQQIAPLDIIVPPPATPTEFNPQGEVSRTDMAQFLLRTYKLITGQNPPVVETPFTDIQELPQEIQDAIAKIYGLKITAGTSATTFSPRDNVTREQMAAFIFNFMRLFGPSRNEPNFANQLANVKSVTFWKDFESRPSKYYPDLEQWINELKLTGLNTVWLPMPWIHYNPRPFANPPEYNEKEFSALIQTLDLLRRNDMKAILAMNYVNPVPEGIDACTWTVDLNMYQAFETYTKEFLRRIGAYSDTVYILFFTEGAEPCAFNVFSADDGPKIAAVLRPTLGSLPQRLDPALRAQFKIGYHDHTLLSQHLSNGESPVQMPLSYDFYSTVVYEQEEMTEPEIRQTFDSRMNNIKAIYPFTPLFVGEFGAVSCNIANIYSSFNSSKENQARVLETGVRKILDEKLGFNIWQWQGKYFPEGSTCPNMPDTQLVIPEVHGLTYNNAYEEFYATVSKPARVSLMHLLNPAAPPPLCIENNTFAQKIIDEHHKQCNEFYSTCIPEGWTVIGGITDCSQACTGEPVWLRNPALWDGLCADENPYPSDCVPYLPSLPGSLGYTIDETCRPSPSPSPSLAPSLSPILTSSPEPTSILPQNSASPSPSPIFPSNQTPRSPIIQTLPSEPSSLVPTSNPIQEAVPFTGDGDSIPSTIFDTIRDFYNSILDFVTGLLTT